MNYNGLSSDSLSPEIIRNICAALQCKKDEIADIEPLKVGLTNSSFSFTLASGKYVYRSPGKGTDSFINRKSEAYSESIAKKLSFDSSLIYIDPSNGWKISRYVENYRYLDPLDPQDQAEAMQLLRRLHNCGFTSPWDFDYGKEASKIASLPDFLSGIDFSRHSSIHREILSFNSLLEKEHHRKVLCHNDFWHWNLLKGTDGNITLIDWEYSGNSYPEADVAYFTASLPFSDADYIALAELYENRPLNHREKRDYFAVMAIVLWYWFVWALYKELLGTLVPDKDMWYERAVHSMQKAKELSDKQKASQL